MKINPESTICFRNQIKEKSGEGAYRINIQCAGMILPLDIFPEVFPPQEELLLGEHVKNFPNIADTDVADIGTGSGVEAIITARLGAKHIDAIDINPVALECTDHNVRLNKLNSKISVISSDLFTEIENTKKYGLILANLPFIDYDGGDGPLDIALYDNGHILHERFLAHAKNHLAADGRILLPHANLQSVNTENPSADFDSLENMILAMGYESQIIIQKPYRNNCKWRLYELKI